MIKQNSRKEGKSVIIQPLRRAFTLSEVLITLVIIGIVAAMTMPGIMSNVNKKAWSEAQYIVRRKMQEATNQMKTSERLHGYDTTEEFVKEFKKYMKIVQICDNTKLKACYAPKVVSGAETAVEVKDLKTSSSLGQKEYHTNTTGLVLGDGTTIILAYNPNCPFIEPTNNTTDTLSCVSMIYDINGKKKPNKIGEDIGAVNAVITDCDMRLGSVCVASSDISFSAINTCAEGSGDPNYTSSHSSHCANNHWYGAKKACEAQGMRLPTDNEIEEIYDAIKNKNISEYNFESGKYYWTSSEANWSFGDTKAPDGAWGIDFSNGVHAVNLKYYSGEPARCVW